MNAERASGVKLWLCEVGSREPGKWMQTVKFRFGENNFPGGRVECEEDN